MKWVFFLILLLALVALVYVSVQLKNGKLSALPKGGSLDPNSLQGTIENFIGLHAPVVYTSYGLTVYDNNPNPKNNQTGNCFNIIGQQIAC